ncbi:MAG: hypothetical protein HC820_06750 [Hydrococcus sp. RM1_1_31]|nr:hypothetical protein [Hydrococcus sp. RM1_1_31]
MERLGRFFEWMFAIFFGLLSLILLLAGGIQGGGEGIVFGIGTALVSIIACPRSPVYSRLPRWGRLAAIIVLGMLL